MDSVEIGLITCTPHEEVYSLYGHTAIHYKNQQTDEDLVFNYGVFNFKAPHFVARFVLGKTDYELGIIPIEPFCKYYKDWGSEVVEQVLNLTNEEKARIVHALAINYRPENRVYRYNFFYDNCSTRPRDIIVHNLVGEVVYAPREDYAPSYREMIHELVGHHPWASMGNDLLLGAKADMKTDRKQQEFLPMNLMHDFEHARIYANGEYRPLVKERRVLVKAGIQVVEEEFPLSPTACAWLLFALLMAVLIIEKKKHQHYLWIDLILMLTTGAAGLLLFVMFFSEHPTTSTNLQILLLNPLSLLFIPSVWRGKASYYWIFMLSCLILFAVGWFIQDYAEGMEILALCLLSRYCSYKI
ncbi:DUF4105 domain-containing protein [Prevotella sp. E9-3]|uniref:lipoprotein N-acyltransferase Lnb domain-containing protein n=1 Tax=Prevotella sp. E9-3 TaxID=2913621 RepID=UPI001EDB926C|nr:DUF4105 domain-containing protein [Prevotella sp. E9-3]UKK47357.1 DUF4105 domain-containing protein [Prevotella sp. E9-3]